VGGWTANLHPYDGFLEELPVRGDRGSVLLRFFETFDTRLNRRHGGTLQRRHGSASSAPPGEQLSQGPRGRHSCAKTPQPGGLDLPDLALELVDPSLPLNRGVLDDLRRRSGKIVGEAVLLHPTPPAVEFGDAFGGCQVPAERVGEVEVREPSRGTAAEVRKAKELLPHIEIAPDVLRGRTPAVRQAPIGNEPVREM
jgi:hypothetical protein